MIRIVPCVALALALMLGCNCAQAMCIRYDPSPNETDPAKAEVREAVARSASIFTGHVTAMEYVPAHTERGNGEMLVIRMVAHTWWKGAGSDEVRLITANYRYSDGTMSSEVHEYPFQLGQTYLVYANAGDDGLHASVCTRTKPVEKAAEDITILDALKSE